MTDVEIVSIEREPSVNGFDALQMSDLLAEGSQLSWPHAPECLKARRCRSTSWKSACGGRETVHPFSAMKIISLQIEIGSLS
jgi:hypothetical protein